MPTRSDGPDPPLPERPIAESYWVVPGRLLVGEYPGSPSRAEAMERLRRFLRAGVTCFVDLTETRELPSYEALLPFATPDGRRVEYQREPIRDHGLPEGPEHMRRILALVDDALAAGHVVYLHCRAGVGRSATVAGCWLAEQRHGRDAYDQLQRCWRQSARSQAWPEVPETREQVEFVNSWAARGAGTAARAAGAAPDLRDRARGALLGLAAGDAAGAAVGSATGDAGRWTQHTALALCLAESLIERGSGDARDQVERYIRWQRDGHLAWDGKPSPATPDVARALANYHWRGLATGGSHDPRDASTSALPRTVSAVLYALGDPAAAVQLAGQCARTTHQSPLVVDACRYYGALLVGALRGDPPAKVLAGLYAPVPGLWTERPLKPAVMTMASADCATRADVATKKPAPLGALFAVARARAAVAAAADFEEAIERACASAVEPALEAALVGTLAGAFHGAAAIPPARVSGLARRDLLESMALRLARLDPGGART